MVQAFDKALHPDENTNMIFCNEKSMLECYVVDTNEIHITSIVTQKHHRNQGYATDLIKKVADYATNQPGRFVLTLDCMCDNDNFYSKRGFYRCSLTDCAFKGLATTVSRMCARMIECTRMSVTLNDEQSDVREHYDEPYQLESSISKDNSIYQ